MYIKFRLNLINYSTIKNYFLSLTIARYLTLILLLAVFCTDAFGETYPVTGKVVDESNQNPLSFANIRIENTGLGTVSNQEGYFELRLPKGDYTCTCTYLGYLSDTVQIRVDGDIKGILFSLSPSYINLSEITVLPGENPANEIIRNAIKKKNLRNAILNSYSFTAYTKGVIKTNQDVSASSNTISIGAGMDTAEMKINGILENESVGFFKKPGSYKEWITARKQTANLPSSINILTGGRIIMNFYSDDINFFGRNLNGPLADNALDYYYFMITDTLAVDTENVFRIFMTPDDSLDPGFSGYVYITASTFDMVKVELNLNRAANTGGLLDTISVYQQFFPFGENIFMPVDYHLKVSAKILGLISFSFQVSSVLYDYKINLPIEDDVFNMAVLTVKTDADKKDSVYWTSMQRIPGTLEESIAYAQIDSINSIPFSISDNFSLISTRLRLSENFSVSAPVSLYHFNRVEGHSIDFSLQGLGYFEERSNSYFNFSYGFSDRKFKYDLTTSYLFGDYRTYEISAGVFNNTSNLFRVTEEYSVFLSSLLALIDKYDFNDYFYSRGFNFLLSGEIFPVLKLITGFYNRTDKRAIKNTDFSFFSTKELFRDNPAIYDTRLNSVRLGFVLDFRKYIEDGKFRRRVRTPSAWNMQIEGGVLYSDKKRFNSSLDFANYTLRLQGSINSFKKTSLDFLIDGMYTEGTLPSQMLNSIPGNINLIARENSIRSLNFNSVLGDKSITAFLEYDLQDELFRLSGIPFLKNLELRTTVFINGVYSDIGDKSRSILPFPVDTFIKPLYEAGFSIGHLLFPVRLSFAWRLNHKEENAFRFGLTSLLID